MGVLPADQFVALWNDAGSLAEVVERVRELPGGPFPRWAVLARAIACRQNGLDLKPFPDEASIPRAGPLSRARELAARLMAEHGLGRWEFGFNNNVRRVGVCHYPTRARPGRIELSRHFVERNPEAEVRDTLLHEIAHAQVGPGHGHDAVWRAKCAELGARPERCYGDHVEMPRGRWRATCPACGREFDRHRRPDRLGGWHCPRCGEDRGRLRWKDAG